MPKQALTSFAGWVAGKERGAGTTWSVRRFVAKYGVNMAEALDSDIASYASFNDFFTRALKPGARPIASADLVSPVDGAIRQFGTLAAAQLFPA
ncbi:phosphatidylserine decarboxylase, partial [Bacillus amyloliquefaciens]|nr:phosphatidylserine decarboxylase [Bacillus amyloliquefaciens]